MEQSEMFPNVVINTDEDIVCLAVAVRSLKLLKEATSKLAVLKDPLSQLCSHENIDLPKFVELHECVFGESIREYVSFMCVDSPLKSTVPVWTRAHINTYFLRMRCR